MAKTYEQSQVTHSDFFSRVLTRKWDGARETDVKGAWEAITVILLGNEALNWGSGCDFFLEVGESFPQTGTSRMKIQSMGKDSSAKVNQKRGGITTVLSDKTELKAKETIGVRRKTT